MWFFLYEKKIEIQFTCDCSWSDKKVDADIHAALPGVRETMDA
jgi:hypothetical protein